MQTNIEILKRDILSRLNLKTVNMIYNKHELKQILIFVETEHSISDLNDVYF